MRKTLTEQDKASFTAPLKFSFVSVMNDEGYPHMNLITSLEGFSDTEMMFSDNYAGTTKDLLEEKKDAGFLALGLDMNVRTGKMHLHAIESEGENLAYYNAKPNSRYNSYFTYHHVYRCNLLGIDGPTQLNPASVMPLVQSIIPKIPALAKGGEDGPVSGAAAEIIGRDKVGKFLAWQGEDGIPEMTTLFGAIPAGSERMVFSLAENEKLGSVPDGAKVTLHCLQLTSMQAVQVRGEFHKPEEGVGYIDVKQVYNPMPPRPAIVWPRKPYAVITEFV